MPAADRAAGPRISGNRSGKTSGWDGTVALAVVLAAVAAVGRPPYLRREELAGDVLGYPIRPIAPAGRRGARRVCPRPVDPGGRRAGGFRLAALLVDRFRLRGRLGTARSAHRLRNQRHPVGGA